MHYKSLSVPPHAVESTFIEAFPPDMSAIILFFQDLVSLCNFHNYDNLRHFAKKLDPRREGGDQRVSPSTTVSVTFFKTFFRQSASYPPTVCSLAWMLYDLVWHILSHSAIWWKWCKSNTSVECKFYI